MQRSPPLRNQSPDMPINPPLKTSAAGRIFIEQWEESGVPKLHPYDDGTGTLTIGFGHTTAAGPPKVVSGLVITAAQADEILSNDLRFVEADINRLVDVPLTQSQFDVLVSFHFNTGALGKSSLLRKLNDGNYGAVPDELMKWVHGGGKVMQGLVNRRKAEGKVWTSSATIPTTGLPRPIPEPTTTPPPPDIEPPPLPKPKPVPPRLSPKAVEKTWWQRAWDWLQGEASS